MIIYEATYGCTNAHSDKRYRVIVHADGTLFTRYGARQVFENGAGTERDQKFPCKEDALAEARRVANKRRRNGYVLVDGFPPPLAPRTTPSARKPKRAVDLARKIRQPSTWAKAVLF